MNDNLDSTSIEPQGEVSAFARENFQKGSVWLQVVAIFAFIGTGFIAISSLFLLFVNPIVGIIYIGITVLYGFMSMLLYKQYKATSGGTLNLDEFSENHMKFWKLAGILMLVSVGLVIISFIFGIAAGGAGMNLFPV
jgi:hypothetical protein